MKKSRTYRLATLTLKEIEEIKEMYAEYEWSNTDIIEMAIANMHRLLVRGEN